MKKLLHLAARALVTLALAALSLPAVADVEINETNFPDSNFRDFLTEQSFGQDGIITDEELASITELKINKNGYWESYSWLKLSDLTGINIFTELTSLSIGYTKLSSLTLELPKLKTIKINDNYSLTSLDINGCPNVESTEFGNNNKLDTLNMSACTKLPSLIIDNCRPLNKMSLPSSLTELSFKDYAKFSNFDFSTLPELETFSFNSNCNVDVLDLSACTKLKRFDCYYSNVSQVKVPKSIDFFEFYNMSGDCSSIDLSDCVNLTEVLCDYNSNLENLDVSGCVNLEKLSCQACKINSFSINGATKLEEISLRENDLTSLVVQNCARLTYLQCWSNNLSTFNVQGSTSLSFIECYQNSINDVGLDEMIESLPIVEDGHGRIHFLLTEYEDANAVTPLQVAAAQAKGWYFFSNTNSYETWVMMTGESETEVPIDEEHFPDPAFRAWLLSQEFGEDEKIGSNDEIREINVRGLGINDLTGLRYFGSNLGVLDCGNNNLRVLDTKYNSGLYSIRCDSNQLSILDLSFNAQLEYLYTYDNKLLTEIILPKLGRYIEYPYFYELYASNCNLSGVKNLEGQSELNELAIDHNPLRAIIDLRDFGQLNYLNIDHCELVALRVNGGASLEYNAVSRDEDPTQFDELVARTGKLGWASADVYEQGVISPQERSIMVERAGRGNNFINFIWNDDRDTNLEGILGDGFKMSSIVDGTLDGGYLVSPGDVIPDDAPDYAKAIDPSQLEAPIILLDKSAGELVFNVTVTGSEDSGGDGILPGILPSPRLKDDDETSDTDRFSQMKVVLKWEDPGYVTAIDSLVKTASPAVAVKYYNASGVAADEPFEGLNIVVTTHADGSRTTDKLVR